MFARLPENRTYIDSNGTYRTHLNFLDRKKTAVQRHIRRGGFGSYEPDFQASLLALCELNEGPLSFYDVGAHIGLYAAVVCEIFNAKNPYVIAIEPTPNTADLATLVRDKNSLAYTIVEAAVSDTHGEIELFISNKAETSNSLNAEFRKSDKSVSVPLTTIDRIVDQGYMPPSIMKIDVETLEAHVLRGALTTIMEHRPTMTLELLGKANMEFVESMLRALEAFGYVFYRVEEKSSDWVESTAEAAMEKVSSSRRDWICSPTALDQAFFDARDAWLSGLEACGEETNIMVQRGEDTPEDLLSGSY